MLRALMRGIPPGPGDSRSSWKRKLEALGAAPRGAQAFRSRRVLQAKGIYPHFSDEETEAETCLEAGAQGGRRLSPEEKLQDPQGPGRQSWDQPGGSPAREAQRAVRLVWVTQQLGSSCSRLWNLGRQGGLSVPSLWGGGGGGPGAVYPEGGDPRLGVGGHLSSLLCDLGQATCPL